MPWTRPQNERLISLFRSRPLLYQNDHPHIYDRERRDDAYLQIACGLQELRPGTTVPEVKKRIKSLRCQFNRERRIKSKGIKSALWWCYDLLKFLENGKKSNSSDMKLEVDDYSMQNSDEKLETFEAFCDDEESDNDEDQFLEEADDEEEDEQKSEFNIFEHEDGHIEEEIIADELECIEEFPAKVLYEHEKIPVGVNDVTSSVKMVRTVAESSMTNSDNGVLSKALIEKLNETLDQTNLLLSKLTHVKESPNRAFIENLLQDLNQLPENELRRTKWKISDFVYTAFKDQSQNAKKPKLS